MLEVLHPGILSLIQGCTRKGYRFYGIPGSGPMDFPALSFGNQILSNQKDAPALECHIKGCTLRFDVDSHICLTGADMHWTINNKKVELNTSIAVIKGDILVGSFAKVGMRAYVCIKGGFKASFSYGSSSTYQGLKIGGHEGRAIKKGDLIDYPSIHSDLKSEYQTIRTRNNQENLFCINIKKGPEWNLLSNESKAIIIKNDFAISAKSNRMGAILSGPRLELHVAKKMKSVPVWPGIVQLPPDGKPIVLLQDGQTTGGYPRIAYLTEEAISKFVQVRFNQSFKFILS